MHPNKKRFRELFEKSRWSQAQVSRELCLTSGAISQFLDDRNPVKPSDAVIKLFELCLDNPETEFIREAPFTRPLPADLLKRIDGLSPRQRQDLHQMLSTLLDMLDRQKGEKKFKGKYSEEN